MFCAAMGGVAAPGGSYDGGSSSRTEFRAKRVEGLISSFLESLTSIKDSELDALASDSLKSLRDTLREEWDNVAPVPTEASKSNSTRCMAFKLGEVDANAWNRECMAF